MARPGAIRFDVWEVIGGRNVMQSQAFRAYTPSPNRLSTTAGSSLENGRYAGGDGGAATMRGSLRARSIGPGYATDPAYASKLIGLMDRYDLYRYDDV